jgi:hypothetical protein
MQWGSVVWCGVSRSECYEGLLGKEEIILVMGNSFYIEDNGEGS